MVCWIRVFCNERFVFKMCCYFVLKSECLEQLTLLWKNASLLILSFKVAIKKNGPTFAGFGGVI